MAPISPRPVTGAVIGSSWGQQVTDALNLPVGARVARTSVQSVAHGSEVAVLFDVELFDDGGFHAAGAPSRLTIASTGWYLFGCMVAFPGHATGFRQLAIKRNGGAYMVAASENPPGANDHYMSVTSARHLTAGDYLEVFVYQTSGAPMSLAVLNEAAPLFWISPGRGLQ